MWIRFILDTFSDQCAFVRMADAGAARPLYRDVASFCEFQRCHRTKVSGLTSARAEGQSKHRASITIVSRLAVAFRRRFVFRSWNNASCSRKRFSAIRAMRESTNKRIRISNSRFYLQVQLIWRPLTLPASQAVKSTRCRGHSLGPEHFRRDD